MQDHVFKLQPSKSYQVLLGIFFLASMAIILCLPLSVLIKSSLVAMVACYGAHMIWVYGLLRGQYSITSLYHQEGSEWIVETSQGPTPAVLLGDSTVTGWVAILRFRLHGAKWPTSCLVFRDSLASASYYSLKVTLLSSRA